ncbi:MAG: hypothetical protein JWM53_3577, partial [bacterium]|nr:hypothetical protein [bacterium]
MDAEERKTAVRKELDDAWLELDRVLSTASEAPDDTALEAVTPFLSSDELVVVDEPPTAEPPAVPGRLLYQRHDSSMLFSTTTFREIAMTAMRGFAAAQASALVTVPPRATRTSQTIATVVPIALP